MGEVTSSESFQKRVVRSVSKRELSNLRKDEEAQFRKAAKVILALTDGQLQKLVECGQFEEVTDHEQKVPK